MNFGLYEQVPRLRFAPLGTTKVLVAHLSVIPTGAKRSGGTCSCTSGDMSKSFDYASTHSG